MQRPRIRRTQGGCGGLGGENRAAFPKAGLIFCAAKVAERKKTKNNPFFHLKTSELCVLNVPTKSAVGWNCIEPEAMSLTMQGFMSPPCRFSCPIAVVAIAWNNCADTQRLGVAEKCRRPVRDFLREKFAKKMPSFPQKYGFENARKISDHILRFLVLVRLQGLFLKISHQATFFSA